MARSTGNPAGKNTVLDGLTRGAKIAAGSVLVVALLFCAGYGIDYMAGVTSRNTVTRVPEKLSAENKHRGGSSQTATPGRDRGVLSRVREKVDRLFRRVRRPSDTAAKRPSAPASIPSREAFPPTHLRSKPPVPETYTIQFGSFRKSAGARSFAERLASKGYEPYIVQAAVTGKGTMYRVRLGTFTDIEQAQKLAAKIEKQENLSVLITSR